jgi:hypothetical protein
MLQYGPHDRTPARPAVTIVEHHGGCGNPSYFPAQNSTPLAFGENHLVGGKLQD